MMAIPLVGVYTPTFSSLRDNPSTAPAQLIQQ
jgi:hypothetical protein